jgi:hypothetical protein
MDDEKIHLLCGIDRLFNDLKDCNYIKIKYIVKNYYLIKNDPYMDNLDYVYDLEMIKDKLEND